MGNIGKEMNRYYDFKKQQEGNDLNELTFKSMADR